MGAGKSDSLVSPQSLLLQGCSLKGSGQKGCESLMRAVYNEADIRALV